MKIITIKHVYTAVHALRKFTCVAGLAWCGALQAQPFQLIEAQPLSEGWVNAGFESYHFNQNLGLNGNNWGLGGEYRFSTLASVTAGRFYNSDREYSSYAGVYYQPIALGPLRIGAVFGGFNGYPHMLNGGWFPAAIPTISYEYQRIGLNLAIVPSYKDRLYGALSFQLKVKLFN